VYTKDVKAKKPVVVYIHGGDFSNGSGCDTGIEHVVESGEVVAVSIQYRLGVLGFLTSTDFGKDNNGGMNGIYDQVMALRWV